MNSVMFDKSKRFAVRIIRLYHFLCDEKKQHTMARQVLRCGTSIGANLAEAEYGISRRDFTNKLYKSSKNHGFLPTQKLIDFWYKS